MMACINVCACAHSRKRYVFLLLFVILLRGWPLSISAGLINLHQISGNMPRLIPTKTCLGIFPPEPLSAPSHAFINMWYLYMFCLPFSFVLQKTDHANS